MSSMAETFKSLYIRGRISVGAVRQAVMDGVITEEEYKYITGEDY